MLRSQRHAQVLLVSTLKRKLNDLETKETEEIRQLELEHSLLGGELEAEKELILKVTIEKTTNVIIRIEFISIGVINVSNGHYFSLETTDNDQLVVTSDI